MQENNYGFIEEVADYYETTVDQEHPNGNMSAVAEHFGITRAKVNKILITAGAIDSPLHQDIMQLKERGYSVEDIATALEVSTTTVRINLPYEKVIYNCADKSAGATYTENFRKREAVYLGNICRKAESINYRTMVAEALETIDAAFAADRIIDDYQLEDDPIHLMARFSKEEIGLFKIHPDLMVLHIEFDEDLSEVKELAGLKYGKTISRDVLVPEDMPLHNLHYVIQQLFGFENYHLHEYHLNEHDFKWLTGNKTANWEKYVGLIFKNPVRNDDFDLWDDDYDGGSYKKYMRSKYTGPDYRKIYEESYPYTKKYYSFAEARDKKLQDLRFEFCLDPFAVNEMLPIGQILDPDGQKEYKNAQEYHRLMDECIEDAAEYDPYDYGAQPFVYSFATSLSYNYDFGDDWNFKITPSYDVEYLVEQGRISEKEIKKAIFDVCVTARPVVLAVDGLPLVEDVGGVYGYIDFLKGINGFDSDMYEDKEESLEWAKSLGWKNKVNKDSLL